MNVCYLYNKNNEDLTINVNKQKIIIKNKEYTPLKLSNNSIEVLKTVKGLQVLNNQEYKDIITNENKDSVDYFNKKKRGRKSNSKENNEVIESVNENKSFIDEIVEDVQEVYEKLTDSINE